MKPLTDQQQRDVMDLLDMSRLKWNASDIARQANDFIEADRLYAEHLSCRESAELIDPAHMAAAWRYLDA